MNPESDPIKMFAELYEKYSQSGVQESSAVILATAAAGGKPSARVVLLKGFDEQGFVFYTNFNSRKAAELKVNPHAALCFYWEPVHYQVRVEGRVQQVTNEEADAYFASRPRDSQIGAWASKQSSTLKKLSELNSRIQEIELKYSGEEIPRPPFWSGFRLITELIEFWERQEYRLHVRTLYTREKSNWSKRLLYP